MNPTLKCCLMKIRYLLCNHGEYWQLYPVELVKASPEPRLAQALEYLRHVGVSLLVRAVCNHLHSKIEHPLGLYTASTVREHFR